MSDANGLVWPVGGGYVCRNSAHCTLQMAVAFTVQRLYFAGKILFYLRGKLQIGGSLKGRISGEA